DSRNKTLRTPSTGLQGDMMPTSPPNDSDDAGDATDDSVVDDDALDPEVYRDVVAEWRTGVASWLQRQVPDVVTWRRGLLRGALVALAVLVVATLVYYLLDRLHFTSGDLDAVTVSPRVPTVFGLVACGWGSRIGAGQDPPLWGAAAAFRFGTAALLPLVFTVGLSVGLTVSTVSVPGAWVGTVVEAVVGALLAWGLARWAGAMPALLALVMNTVGSQIVGWAWLSYFPLESLLDTSVVVANTGARAAVYVVAILIGVLVLARQGRPWGILDAGAVGAF